MTKDKEKDTGAFDKTQSEEKLKATDEQYRDKTGLNEETEAEQDVPAMDASVAAQFKAAEDATKES